MSLFDVFGIAGSAMSSESVRLNVTASNLANAQSIGPDEASTYHARHPVFSAVMQSLQGVESPGVGVRVGVRVLVGVAALVGVAEGVLVG